MKQKKNILYGDIEIEECKKTKVLKEVVFLDGDTEYKGKKIISVINFKVVGQTNTATGYTEVKASDEKRNNITGAYE